MPTSEIAAHTRWRKLSYSELVDRIDAEPTVLEERSPSGVPYQIEIQVFWDDQTEGDIRVLGAIDDGGWRSFVPLTVSFIMYPDGSLA